MRIQHNITAQNAYRQLGGNNNAVSKNLEKLSSGYRINRAGDDAAGLAISEKMRSQIKGLETAQKNSNDGISLVQTAEGALTEVHSMLNRMTELATQSANGTYDNTTDRANLQKEVDSLLSEIDRIAESTNFNGIKLLDGSLSGGGKAGDLVGAAIASYKGAELTSTGAAGAEVAFVPDKNETVTIDLSGAAAEGADNKDFIVGGVTIKSGAATSKGAVGGAADATIDKTLTGNALASALADILNSKTGVTGAKDYTWSADGGKLVATAKTNGNKTDLVVSGDSKAATTGVASTTISNGSTPAGIDFFQKDTINIDGTEIKVDWSKLDQTQKDALTKDWSAAGTPSDKDVKAAAKVMQDTINQAIKDHNAANGTALNEIKVEGTGDGVADASFNFTSGQKDGDSKISFTGGDQTVLGKMLGGAAQNSTAPVKSLNLAAADLMGKFNMKLGDQNMEVDLTGVTSANDIDAALQSAIDAALKKFDASQGNTGDDVMEGKVSVKMNSSGALEFVNNTGKTLGFEDKAGGEVAKNLGISAEGKAVAGGGLTLQVGDTNESFQKVNVSVGDMSAKSLGIDGVNVKNQAGAGNAIAKIKDAINSVSSTRGDLGAVQNRLEHTINNLGVTSENMTAAESRIRDVDMASEMMNFTKNNILTQAAQSMLAQANQLPQGVLQLLQ